MFVKIENENNKYPVILNIDCISSLDGYRGHLTVKMTNGDVYLLTEQQYDELCKILTTRL
jgi:hypothetical protein